MPPAVGHTLTSTFWMGDLAEKIPNEPPDGIMLCHGNASGYRLGMYRYPGRVGFRSVECGEKAIFTISANRITEVRAAGFSGLAQLVGSRDPRGGIWFFADQFW